MQGVHLCATPHVQHVADMPAANPLLQLTPRAGTCDCAETCAHGELPDLLLERHGGEQPIDASHSVALR
jgi:hypothetical protein